MGKSVQTGTMLHPGLASALGYRLQTADGVVGRVTDWYFDDMTWAIRYVVVDTGSWLRGRRVLISPSVVGVPDIMSERLPVNLTRQQVKESPPWNGVLPVSRQHEIDLQRHYGWPSYWPDATVAGAIGMPPLPSRPMMPEPGDIAREVDRVDPHGDPHLRSVRKVTTYDIHAQDGHIGTAIDVLVEPTTWIIRYLVTDTGKWIPGRKVLISPQWIERIDWSESAIHVRLTRDGVRESPNYDPESVLDRAYEHVLYEHYGFTKYWL